MSYDLIVIGSGPGGYVCAVRAAQLGLKTAIVEKEKTLGGTCLNIGCIPSKALLQASEHFEEAKHGLAAFGVIVGEPKLDHKALMKHKDDTVASNVNGVAFLMKKNKIDVHVGVGSIPAAGKVVVTPAKGEAITLETKAIVIATGSVPAMLPGVVVDERKVVTSTGALLLEKVPERLIVIGAGIIGLELGSVWGRLGAKVEVIEFLDRILPGMDGEVAKQMQRLLQKQGFTFHLSQKVTKVENGKGGCKVIFEPVGGGEAQTIDADIVLVATGRRPTTEGLGLDVVKVATEKGRVVIDDHFQTNVTGIYAIGDVVRGPMLAHKAEDEGVAVAEIIAGKAGHVNYDVIPGVVYTQPEVAAVGRTEEELKEAGVAYNVGRFPFTANARARAMRHTDGFVKFLADKATDKVLGAHIVGYVGRRDDPRNRCADGIRGLVRRSGAHMPRPSDPQRSGQGSSDGRREALNSHLA